MLHRPRGTEYERLAGLISERGGELGKPLYLLDDTTSTNEQAKRAAKQSAPHGATWIAETQSAGRGRQGRVWMAPRGESVLVSVLFRLTCPPSRLPPLAVVAGLAARDAIARAVDPSEEVLLKWPNDVRIGEKKVAGVLVESIVRAGLVEALIVGVGINVHTRTFPEEIASIATSVALHASGPPDRAAIAADRIAALDRDIPVAAARGLGSVHERISAVDALRGREVQSDADASKRGVSEGIDVEGRLLVRTVDGSLERWNAGEVHIAYPIDV